MTFTFKCRTPGCAGEVEATARVRLERHSGFEIEDFELAALCSTGECLTGTFAMRYWNAACDYVADNEHDMRS